MSSGEEQAALDQGRQVYEHKLDNHARMRDAGVTMVCGSDSAWGRYKMGGFQYEVEAQVEEARSQGARLLTGGRVGEALDRAVGVVGVVPEQHRTLLGLQPGERERGRFGFALFAARPSGPSSGSRSGPPCV